MQKPSCKIVQYVHRFPRTGVSHDFTVRWDNCDVDTIRTVSPYSRLSVDGDIVLDVGGHIGSYAILAHHLGAKEIHSFEPDPENCWLFNENTRLIDNIHLREYALTTDRRITRRSLYRTRNMSANSLFITRGRSEVEVHTWPMYLAYETIKPTALKLDCEGSEYDILEAGLPHFVKKVICEFHFAKSHWRQRMLDLLPMFNDWECLREAKNTGRNWHTIGIWQRK